MAFIAEIKTLRVYDPEKGIELKCTGIQTGGQRNFAFHTVGQPETILGRFSADFEAHRLEEIEEEILKAYPEAKEFGTYKVLGFEVNEKNFSGFGRQEATDLIRDALEVFRRVGGRPEGTAGKFFVHFPDQQPLGLQNIQNNGWALPVAVSAVVVLSAVIIVLIAS